MIGERNLRMKESLNNLRFLQNFERKRIRVILHMQLVDWADNTNRTSSFYLIFAVCKLNAIAPLLPSLEGSINAYITL